MAAGPARVQTAERKEANARTKSVLPRTRGCRLRPSMHCALLPLIGRLQRLQSGSHLRFVRPQAMQPPHNQANKRAHSSIVASNVQQVYLTPFLECNTPGARDVVPRDLPSSGMIAPAKLPQLYGDHDAYGEVRGCPPKRCEGNRGQRRWQRRRINRAVH